MTSATHRFSSGMMRRTQFDIRTVIKTNF
uniref:Uncharacterized protein n=1 Tax=Anguilla anguilla TaxID=7936 RepID=A0A0E9UAZ0_ANGAN